jgi:hypothetical protein
MNLQKLLTTTALFPLSLAAILLATSCSDKSMRDEGATFAYVADDAIAAERDEEDDCLFLTEVDGRGKGTLRAALVTASGGPTPAALTLSKDGGEAATAGIITPDTDDDGGWVARFTVSGIGATTNGPVGTDLSFDGTWAISLSMADGDSCANVPVPLVLELVEKD